ncbi:hypothetical protein MHJ96_02980, partial [Corynebacterium aurimucosum]|nr:hypothetical protein [Corynebacterium aurimucosum]
VEGHSITFELFGVPRHGGRLPFFPTQLGWISGVYQTGVRSYRGQSHLPQVIDAMFNTDQLEAESKRLDEKIRALASEIESLVAENQRVAQDQDQYLARYTQLEARYQKTLGRKQAIEAEIAAKSAKATAIKTAYTQLADKPIQHFQPSQWTALIDHAVIGANEIQFVFRIGTEITVPIASRLPVSSTS